MSSRHFNHNPVTGEGRAPSRPPPPRAYPFLTQKWYRPGARCTRATLGAWRPNAEGSQCVTTDWTTGPPTT